MIKSLEKDGPYLFNVIAEVLERSKKSILTDCSLAQKERTLFKMLDSLGPLVDVVRCLSIRSQLLNVAEQVSDIQKAENENLQAISEFSEDISIDSEYPSNFDGIINQVREDFVYDLINLKNNSMINSEAISKELLLNNRLGLEGVVYKQSSNEIFGNAFKRPFEDSQDQVNLFDKWRSLPSFYIYMPIELEVMYKKPLKWCWLNDIEGSSDKNLMVEYFDGQIITLFRMDINILLENYKWRYFRSFYLGTEWVNLA